jgi:hypothetical protein
MFTNAHALSQAQLKSDRGWEWNLALLF